MIQASYAANNIVEFAQISCISDEKQELGNTAGFQRLLVVDEFIPRNPGIFMYFRLAGVA